MRHISLAFSIVVLFLPGTLPAQIYPIQNSVVSLCGGIFTDSGLLQGNYSPGENITMTICANGVDGTHTRLSFSGVDIRPGDALCFFDGPTALAPPLTCHDQFQTGAPFVIQATPLNASGCLTVRFTSDGGATGKGWTSTISCVPACQAFSAQVLSAQPPPSPSDTGWIDICPGDEVSFSGDADFFQNNLLYAQETGLCTFEWDFGDGNLRTGISASNRYDKPGGYTVTLAVIDQLGCRNTNFIKRRVRVSPPPAVHIGALPGPLCMGDTIDLSAGSLAGGSEDLQVLAQEGRFEMDKIRADSLPLPDGTGALYQTSLIFNEFGPDQFLTDPSQIQSLCINIEHSWMRDLRITLTCPSGQSVVLVNQEETGEEVFLGEPFEDDELLPVPIPGVGYTYCWSHDAPNGTWLDYANQFKPKTLPPATYSSFESMEGLLGCPLNGAWTISIEDLWAIDNGYIFWWNLGFEQSLLPPVEKFLVPIQTLNWQSQPNIFLHKGREILATAHTAGQVFFRLNWQDQFQCSADTFITLPVLAATDPACRNCLDMVRLPADTLVCQGDSFMLKPEITGFQGGSIPFASHPMYALGFSNHPPANPYRAGIPVNHIYPYTLGANGDLIESVCFNLKTYPVNNIAVWLEAPDGKLLELTTYNGGLGTDYRNTCFTPASVVPVTTASAPFSGNYRPEGNWNDLDGSPVNGAWNLLVSDNFGINRMGLLENWSITFKAQNAFNYIWGPAGNLSCSSCPDPMAYADQNRTYQLIVSDQYACSAARSIQVNVAPKYDAPTITHWESEPAGLRIYWNAVPGAPGYEVNVNQGGWIPANGSLQHFISGLPNNTMVDFRVRVPDSNPNCPSEVGIQAILHLFCSMYGVVELAIPPSCFGGSDGQAFISAFNGTAPFNYQLNGQFNQPIGYFNAVPGGAHLVIVTDAMGCADTLAFDLVQPDPIAIALTVDSVSCFGGNNGSASAQAMGGTSPFSYTWFTIPAVFGPTLGNRPAGSYPLRVTDSNGCIRDTSVSIHQPMPLTIQIDTDSVSCHGMADGMAGGTVSGGNLPYQYLWSNGGNGFQITGLAPGSYTLTVTDAKGCSTTTAAMIGQPPVNQYSLGAESPTCFNGTDGRAWITPILAPAPLTYRWMDALAQTGDTAVALPAGGYVVIARDARGCLDTFIVIVPSADSMTLTVSSDMASCPGTATGRLTVDVTSGGEAPFTFLWSDADAQTGSTALGLPGGFFSVTVTDAKGCSQSAAGVVELNEGLEVALSGINASCLSSMDGQVAAVVTGGTWPYTFQWNDPAAGTDSLLLQVAPGTYSVTVTGSKGCTGTATITLVAENTLMIDGIIVSDASCAGASDGQLEALISGGNQPYGYSWSDPAAQTSGTAVGLSAGNYGVTVTDATGCQVWGAAFLGEPEPIQVAISATSVACRNGMDGSLEAVVMGGTPGYQFLWSTTPAQTGATATGLAAGSYSLTVTDQQGCSAVVQAIVPEPAASLMVSITQHLTGCFGSNGNGLTVTTSGGQGPPLGISWSNGEASAVIEGLADGVYQVTVTDAGGCQVSQSYQVVSLSPVTVTIAGVPPSCHGLMNGSLGVTGIAGGVGNGMPGAYQFQWSTLPVQSGVNAVNLAGNRQYHVTATDALGCSGTASFFLTEPLPMTASTLETPVSCQGDSNGQLRITQVSGGTGPYTYAWPPALAIGNQSLATDLPAGTYVITITDAGGCVLFSSLNVTEPAPLTLALMAQTHVSCHGDSNGALILGAEGGNGSYSFQWGNGRTGATQDDLPAGNYLVTVTDLKGCERVENFTVTEPPALGMILSAEPPDCVQRNNGQIEVFPSGGTPPYQFALQGQAFGLLPVFGRLSGGQYVVTLRDQKGCMYSESVLLEDPADFSIDLGDDVTISSGESVTLQVTDNSPVPIAITWKAPYEGTLSCTQCPNPVASPAYTITYKAIATDDRGCQASDEITVIVITSRTVLVPTAFTPNGDGQNDLLLVHGHEGTTIRSMRVFDRWGETVFEAGGFSINDPIIGWDGRFRGAELNPGVYIWVLEVEFPDGFRQQFTGQTTLIR